jgi:LPS-assembly protein
MDNHFRPASALIQPTLPHVPRPIALPLPRLLSVLVALAWGVTAQAQVVPPAAAAASAPDSLVKLRSSRVLGGATKGSGKPAMVLSADRLVTQVDQKAEAEGHTELRYGDLVIQADHVDYAVPTDLARATGQVRISHEGNLFTGPELSLYVSRFEGEFLTPSFFLAATGGTGRAQSIQFIDAGHLRAKASSYTSCPRDEVQEPAWQITARTINFDLEGNEGAAEGAVLRFLGVPILAAPALSFPLGSERKSGLLPPNVFLDSRSGLEYGQPYYWNIAPQRDATFTPFIMTRRGPGLDSELRYLEPEHKGRINVSLLPHDHVSGRSRWATLLRQDGRVDGDWRYRLQAERVSDDDYWKDMSRRVESQTPRLLAGDLQLARAKELSWGQIDTYARVQRWQALQGTDPLSRFTTPYQRSPQIGVRLTTAADEAVLDSFRPWGRKAQLEGGLELEYNRFDLPSTALAEQKSAGGGQRVHVLGHIAAPLGGEAWWLIPRLSLNAASYSLDQPDAQGRRHPGRVIPSLSIDQGWVLERDTTLFGSDYRQTLEPRLLYVNTPYRAQADLPNFDAAPKDFNFDSIYTDNPFSGVDRVADLNALSLGATSRWVNAQQGEEVLRLGAVQRFLFRDQRITPDGTPVTQRFSDLLLAANAHLTPTWWADGAVEFNPQTNRSVRSVVRARYNPGPFRTASVAYRYARGQSEQVELAWQWPLWGQENRAKGSTSGNGSSCGGAWYSAGRLQYSLHDRRLTDSVAGVEYDAGCWLLRMGVERLSTGRAETKTQFMIQLELVGLSSLGSNALKVLKDNVPGYRRLSADRSPSTDFQP